MNFNTLKRRIHRVLICAALLCGVSHVNAQNIQVDTSLPGTQLVDALVTGNSCAQFSNVTVSGAPSGNVSYGYFSGGGPEFPMQSGIILSSGFASSAPGPNGSVLSDNAPGWGGDPDLEDALGITNTRNATVLEFDFVPFNSHISFDYLFSSEEYRDWGSMDLCNYSDGFAFLLREAGSTGPYQNLAVIPGSATPVKVTTVRGEGFCPSANEAFFDAFNNVSYPTNFGGQTKVLTAEADVIPGTTYHIKLVIADQGDDQYDSAIFLAANSFNAGTDLGEDRLLTTGNPLCQGTTLTLDGTTPGAVSYKWFKDNTEISGATSALLNVTDAGDYSVEAQLSSTCVVRGEIKVETAAVPTAGNHTLLQCDADNDGLASFNLDIAKDMLAGGDATLTVSYHPSAAEARANTGAIANTSAYLNTVPNELLYYRVANQYGCFDTGALTLATSPTGLTTPAPFEQCDQTDGNEDGLMRFDLTQKDAEILQGLPAGLQLQYYLTQADALAALNPIANPASFVNTIAGTQTVYARVNSGADCYGVAPLVLKAFVFGQQMNPEEPLLCTNGNVTLHGGMWQAYKWVHNGNIISTMPQVTVTEAGLYTLTVTNALGCTADKQFDVQLSGIAENIVVETVDFSDDANSLTILATGPGVYEYSLDGITFQAGNVFTGLASGEYTVYVKDANGCVPVVIKTAYILDFPRFFTPNGDGQNDTWRVPYLFLHPKASITVFDRYGKILASLKGNSSGWNGSYDGKPLPANDYWFVLQMEDGRTIKGHFSLLR